ncbi:MAG: DegT/DnrJ/EryC1/StrS family aminotransferase [Bacilli bacterium]
MNEIISKLEKKISTHLKINNIYLCGSGTESFFHILDNIDLDEKDEILLPNFLCEILMVPILSKNIKYRLVDNKENSLLPSLFEYKNSYTKNTKIVLISYLWGYVHEDIDEIVEWAKKENLIIIEDISSAYNLMYKNKKLGTLGDYCFGSFGKGKFIDVGKYGFFGSNSEVKCFDILKGTSIINYNRIIKLIRKVESEKIRKVLTILFLKRYKLFLKTKYDYNSLIFLNKELNKIEKTYLKRKRNSDKFIKNLKQCTNIDIIVPNNNIQVASRIACLCKNKDLKNKLKSKKCWVGFDYHMPINKMINNNKLKNSEEISDKIVNLLTNVNNNTINKTIMTIKEDAVYENC